MMMVRQLFNQGRLEQVIAGQQESIRAYVERLEDNRFVESLRQELVDHVVSRFTIQPIQLHEPYRESSEGVIDVSRNPQRHIPNRSRAFNISSLELVIIIPFTGNPELLDYFPAVRVYQGSPPKAEVTAPTASELGIIRMKYSVPLDRSEQLTDDLYRQDIDFIQYVTNTANEQVEAHNKELQQLVAMFVDARMARKKKIEDTFAKLTIPLKKKPESPDYTAIPIRQVIVKPLPQPPNIKPEPGISDEDYKTILSIIRHSGRSFETTPSTFCKLDEEELRDVVVAYLNGIYKGEARGEVFRKSGKTDIHVQTDDRSAFVGECKIWHGEQAAKDAIDQLLSYSTWRDCKGALVFFNKENKHFAKIQEKMSEVFTGHPNYIRTVDPGQPHEWCFQMKSSDDPDREVTVQVFLINLYVQPK